MKLYVPEDDTLTYLSVPFGETTWSLQLEPLNLTYTDTFVMLGFVPTIEPDVTWQMFEEP